MKYANNTTGDKMVCDYKSKDNVNKEPLQKNRRRKLKYEICQQNNRR